MNPIFKKHGSRYKINEGGNVSSYGDRMVTFVKNKLFLTNISDCSTQITVYENIITSISTPFKFVGFSNGEILDYESLHINDKHRYPVKKMIVHSPYLIACSANDIAIWENNMDLAFHKTFKDPLIDIYVDDNKLNVATVNGRLYIFDLANFSKKSVRFGNLEILRLFGGETPRIFFKGQSFSDIVYQEDISDVLIDYDRVLMGVGSTLYAYKLENNLCTNKCSLAKTLFKIRSISKISEHYIVSDEMHTMYIFTMDMEPLNIIFNFDEVTDVVATHGNLYVATNHGMLVKAEEPRYFGDFCLSGTAELLGASSIMSVHSEGDILVAVTKDSKIFLKNLTSGRLIEFNDEDVRAFTCCAIHGNMIYAGTACCSVWAYKLNGDRGKVKKMELLHTFKKDVNVINVCDGYLYAGSADSSVIVLNLQTNRMRVLEDHKKGISSLVVCQNLITFGMDRYIRFYLKLGDACIATFQHSYTVHKSIEVGGNVAILDETGMLSLLDVTSRKIIESPFKYPGLCMGWSFSIASYDSEIYAIIGHIDGLISVYKDFSQEKRNEDLYKYTVELETKTIVEQSKASGDILKIISRLTDVHDVEKLFKFVRSGCNQHGIDVVYELISRDRNFFNQCMVSWLRYYKFSFFVHKLLRKGFNDKIICRDGVREHVRKHYELSNNLLESLYEIELLKD